MNNSPKYYTVLCCILFALSVPTYFIPEIGPGITITLLILAVIFAMILICILVKTRGLARLPEQTVNATVSGKNVVETVHSDEAGTWRRMFYKVTFNTEYNISWTFDLSLELYNALLPGDYGLLVYKVNKRLQVFYEGFIRKAP